MSVGKICVREVDTAKLAESVAVAAVRMHQRAVGTLVVVNNNAQPVGIVTDRDLVARVLATGRDPTVTSMSDVMTPDPKTVSEQVPIESALSIMRSGRFRRLPVLDRDNRLIGLVTLDDILMFLAEEFEQIGRLLERETPRGVIEAQGTSLSGVIQQQTDTRLGVGD
jgi:CBS domain-containing protein